MIFFLLLFVVRYEYDSLVKNDYTRSGLCRGRDVKGVTKFKTSKVLN